MHRLPVESSDIVSIGYDAAAKTLEVEFREQRIYQYFDVPADIYERFMRAESFGTYFFAHINGRYRYERLKNSETGRYEPAHLAFVTGNVSKFRQFKAACEKYGITVEQLDLPVDEVQSSEPAEIALKKAKHAYKLAGRPVVVNDSFWSILALRGFPGAYARDIDGWLTAADYLKLMEGKKNRTVFLTDTVVYYDGKRAKTFSSQHQGTIVDEARGEGPSLSRLIIMNGQSATIAEIYHQDKSNQPLEEWSYCEFAKWYNMHRKLTKR